MQPEGDHEGTRMASRIQSWSSGLGFRGLGFRVLVSDADNFVLHVRQLVGVMSYEL